MVMYRGKVVGIVPGNTSRDKLGLMMAGVTDEVPSEHTQNEGAQA